MSAIRKCRVGARPWHVRLSVSSAANALWGGKASRCHGCRCNHLGLARESGHCSAINPSHARPVAGDQGRFLLSIHSQGLVLNACRAVPKNYTKGLLTCSFARLSLAPYQISKLAFGFLHFLL